MMLRSRAPPFPHPEADLGMQVPSRRWRTSTSLRSSLEIVLVVMHDRCSNNGAQVQLSPSKLNYAPVHTCVNTVSPTLCCEISSEMSAGH